MDKEKSINEAEECLVLPIVSNAFTLGQKVWCSYHHTRLFKPPMCGRILAKIPLRIKHHFSQLYKDGKDGKCTWYLVLMGNNLIVLMPGTCIVDLMDEIKQHDNINKTPLDPKQIDAWETLQKWQADRVRFMYR